MATYIISYDLRKERNYEALYAAIKAYGTWAKVLESLWAIKTTQVASQIRDDLRKYVDEDDGLFVIKSGVEAAWHKVNCKNEWLKTNL